ncbi:hypothetical protein AMK22_29930 [Streptomyces sp. CB01580]|nr:hypothetical protein AMK22_29930 [Streptomyces sp. CB01580]
MTVIKTTAETPDQTAVTKENKPTRHTPAQQSEKHRLPPETGSTDQLQATLPRLPRNPRRHPHHEVATIGRLRALTASGDFAYFTDIAHFMARLPLPTRPPWLDGPDTVCARRQQLVQDRRVLLEAAE